MITLILRQLRHEAREVVLSLRVALRSLQSRQCQEDNQENQTRDSQHKHDFDDRKALCFRFVCNVHSTPFLNQKLFTDILLMIISETTVLASILVTMTIDGLRPRAFFSRSRGLR